MAELQRCGEDMWVVDGPPVSAFGPVKLPTRMIVVKLPGDALWINSPIEPSDDVLAQIERLGSVRYLVAPTPMHVWRLESWSPLFPDAQLWGPPKAKRATADRVFDGLLDDDAPPGWAGEIDQVVFRGNVFFDEVEFFHRRSRTLMITDFIQNYPAVDGDAVRNFAGALGGVLNGGVPRDIRWSFTRRALTRASLAKMLAWDFEKLIVAHGVNVEHDARAFVERAFRWLNVGR